MTVIVPEPTVPVIRATRTMRVSVGADEQLGCVKGPDLDNRFWTVTNVDELFEGGRGETILTLTEGAFCFVCGSTVANRDVPMELTPMQRAALRLRCSTCREGGR